ncbi:MAG: hypothetical protein DLM72_08675 [Candidatus Nitrosopolaris wilkensis]|nr:MAG: hypothetical protein DLM72_08675 [Candidatus Nitrosopolaris wilkensis]
MDNNLNTRWSNLGVGSFIQADLGGQKTICSVDIAWYRGNLRVNNFVISVSSDGTSFTNVFTGKSSGTTLSAEKFSLPTSATARFVRVTVNRNTENNWASVTELSVEGASGAQQNPTADNIAIQTKMNAPAQITLTGFDPRGEMLNFTVHSMPRHGNLTSGPTAHTVTYTPLTGFTGNDSFTYQATDGQRLSSNIATVTITVNPTSPPSKPTADNKIVQTNANTSVPITLTGTSPIPNDVNLKFSVVANPHSGTLSNHTTIPNTVIYTPNGRFSGTDSFTYKAIDGQRVTSNIATVTITVKAPPPPAPTVDNINVQTNKGTPIEIPLRAHDPIPGDMPRFSVVVGPQHGTVTNSSVSSSRFYTPATGFIGTDSFTYKATDSQGVDSNIATVTIIVSNATSGILDQFGIKQLNPSKPGGERWFFNGATGDPNNDPRTGTPNEGPHTTFTHKNPDGSWNVQASQVRYGVLTSTLFQENQIKTLNQQQMAAQGFMLRPNDWKNVELTAYLRVVHATGSSTNGAAHIEFGAHGARNTNGGTVGGFDSSCEATAYHSNTYLTGRVKFEKDLKHTAGYSVESADAQKQNAVNTTEFNGQNWIGIKLVVYDFGNTSVKVEQWVDDHSSNIIQPGNHWRKVLETVDHGQWGPTRGSIGSACGGGEFQIASWGGPIALFRWDNIDDMDIKNASVREIIPLA